MIKFIRSILPAANRVVLGATVALDVGVGLIALVTEFSATDEPTSAGAIVLVNGLAVLFVKGWQQFEKAIYQKDLLAFEHAARTEQFAAQQTVGKAGSKPPSLNLPR